MESLLDKTILESLAALGERRGKDLLAQLVALFSEQGPKAFAAMRQALADGNSEVLRETAHSLKGSYRSLGVTRLAEISSDLEGLGRSGRFDGVEGLMDDLEATFTLTEEALQEFIASRRGVAGG
ncbi:MAG: Hpt domain-containing protein [Acidobacteriota bacterium]